MNEIMYKILYFFVGFVVPLVFSFQSTSILHNVRLFRKISSVVLKNAMTSEQFRKIAEVPKRSFDINKVVGFIQEWASIQSEAGAAIITSTNEQGADFSLQFQDHPFLIVNAVEEREHVNVQVKEHIDVSSEKAVPVQLRSLLRLTSNNLIDSLSSELNDMVIDSINTEEELPSGPDDEVCELPHYEFTEDEIDFNYLNKHAKDIRTMLPNKVDIEHLWQQEGTPKIPSTSPVDVDFIDINTNTQANMHQYTMNTSQSIPIPKKQMNQINQEETIYTWETACTINIDIITITMGIWVRKYIQGAGLSIAKTRNESIKKNLSEKVNDRFVTAVSAKILPSTDYNMQSVQLSEDTTTAIHNLISSLCRELSQVIISNNHNDHTTFDTPPHSAISTVSNKYAPNEKSTEATTVLAKDSSTNTVEYSFTEIEEAVRGVQCAQTPAKHPAGAGAGLGATQQQEENQQTSTTTTRGSSSSDATGASSSAASAIPPLNAFKRRDPATMAQAAELGLRLEKFEGCGLEDAAMTELNAMLHNTQKEGFLNILKEYNATITLTRLNTTVNNNNSNLTAAESANLLELFQQGQKLSTLSLQELLQRPTLGESAEELLKPTPQLPMLLDNPSLARGNTVDIFQSPSELRDGAGRSSSSTTATTAPGATHITTDSGTSSSSSSTNTASMPNPVTYELDQQRLDMLVTELSRTDPAFHDSILEGFRELFYSDNILYLLKCANTAVIDPIERQLYKKITEKTITLMAELGALIKTESMRHLQTISDVCTISAEYQHDERQFQERMYYMKPRFDTALLSYLTHAIQEEETLERQKGVDPHLAPSVWLQILTIIKKGVTAEFELRYRNQLEMLLLVIRFDDSAVRSEIFRRFVSITPPMELPYLKALALNMIDGILGTDYGRQIPLALSETSTTSANTTTDSISDTAIGRTSHSHDLNAALGPYSMQQPLPPAYALSSDARADPSLIPRMEALLKDVNTHLHEQLIHTRIQAFQEEVRQQGKNIVVRHRNSVIQNEIETEEELASSRD